MLGPMSKDQLSRLKYGKFENNDDVNEACALRALLICEDYGIPEEKKEVLLDIFSEIDMLERNVFEAAR